MIHYLSEIVLFINYYSLFIKFVSSWENVSGINTMEFLKFLQLAFSIHFYTRLSTMSLVTFIIDLVI